MSAMVDKLYTRCVTLRDLGFRPEFVLSLGANRLLRGPESPQAPSTPHDIKKQYV